MTTLRDKLIETVKRRYKTIEISGIGGVRLQSLTEREYSQVEDAQPEDRRPLLIAKTLVDVDDSRVFADDEIDTISKMDFAVANAIAEHAMVHCRARTTVEDSIKN